MVLNIQESDDVTHQGTTRRFDLTLASSRDRFVLSACILTWGATTKD